MSERADDKIYSRLSTLVKLRYSASGFSFLPRQPVQSILSGRHGSRLRGRGLNFEELRHYRAGDDIRTMDWKVTNRTKKPHVRVYTEERERPVLLLVDQRMSMFFGSQQKMKSVVAAELAALCAWRVLAAGDRIGAVVFDDKQITAIKPQRSQSAVMQILNSVINSNHNLNAELPYRSDPAQFNQALKELVSVCGHDYLLVIISDMFGWDNTSLDLIKRLSQHNDVITSLVFDPLERDGMSAGKYLVSDGLQQITFDPAQGKSAEKLSQYLSGRLAEAHKQLKKHRIPLIPMVTTDDTIMQVRRALGGVPQASAG